MDFRRSAFILCLKFLSALLFFLAVLYALNLGVGHRGTVSSLVACLVSIFGLFALRNKISYKIVAAVMILSLSPIVYLRLATTFPSQSALSSWFVLLSVAGIFFVSRSFGLVMLCISFSVFGSFLILESSYPDLWEPISSHSTELPVVAKFVIQLVAAALTLLFASAYEKHRKVTKDEQDFLLSTMRLGLWKWSKTTDRLEMDQACLDLLGENRQSDEIFNLKEILEILPSLERKQLIENFLLTTGKNKGSFELDFVHGKKRLKLKGDSYDKQSNENQEYFGILVDNTLEFNLREELDQQQEENFHNSKMASIGHLAAGVGHEINNPLAIATGYVEALRLKYVTKNIQPEMDVELTKIEDACFRVARIVQGLRLFTSGASSSGNEQIDFQNFLEELNTTLGSIYEKEGIKLEIQIPKDEVYLRGDERKIHQVFLNILSNAKDAVKDNSNGKISISFEKSGTSVAVLIKNNGPKIPADIRAKIFDPFFTTKDVNSGTGLGLAISHGIIKSYGGQMLLEKSDHEHTIFRLEFKIVRPNEEDSSSEIIDKHFSSENILEKLKIVLVDDEKEILNSFKQLIPEKLKYEMVEFTSPKDALQYFKGNKNSVDLLVTDMKMPGGSGFDLIESICELEDDLGKRLFSKSIIISGGVDIDLELLSESHDRIDSYLYKPFSSNDLKNMFSKLFILQKNQKAS